MFKFDNTHIFTGYLKQLLSTFNLPTCRIYTKEFAIYAKEHGKEDPRIIESFDNIEYSTKDSNSGKKRIAARFNYLKGNELYTYFWPYDQEKSKLNHNNCMWKRTSSIFYDSTKNTPGLTKTLKSPGIIYDSDTHEYLGDYLRFLRDYSGINLMSLYNCFNNKICSNLYYQHAITVVNSNFDKSLPESKDNQKYSSSYRLFDARDAGYRIYAFPVKLFSDYTIAIDCNEEIEMFCGIYRTRLEDTSAKAIDLINKTYKKVNRTFFKQPFLYDKLNVKYWNFDQDTNTPNTAMYPHIVDGSTITRWDVASREQDLKLFIKIPVSCKSSIVVLEGDFRGFNDFKYQPPGKYTPCGKPFDAIIDNETISQTNENWEFKQNHSVVNFKDSDYRSKELDINDGKFTPISKLQLLAFNTGESYPFADRLIEYLCGSAITSTESIADNIKRAQKVMSQNHHYFKIDGIWEDKMQKILYDYMINSGPIEVKDGKLVDRHSGLNPKNYGYHRRLGHTTKSTLYDVLGYVDKDAEKLYSSWYIVDNKAKVKDNIQNVDIYNGLYDV